MRKVEGYPKIRVSRSGYIELPKIRDERDGHLNILEAGKHVSFPVRRLYYINQLEQCVSIRGKHAHRALQQVIFCVSGSFSLGLDDGEQTQEILMWRDNVGVLLAPGLWHSMFNFSNGCVILVVASDHYDEEDYIRDYDEFLTFTRQLPSSEETTEII